MSFLKPPSKGCTPGKKRKAEKAKLTDDQRLLKKRAYEEEDRSRAFLPSWLTEYKWLRFDPGKNMMFCESCRTFPAISDR